MHYLHNDVSVSIERDLARLGEFTTLSQYDSLKCSRSTAAAWVVIENTSYQRGKGREQRYRSPAVRTRQHSPTPIYDQSTGIYLGRFLQTFACYPPTIAGTPSMISTVVKSLMSRRDNLDIVLVPPYGIESSERKMLH
jgi:hypothetical protein